MIPADAIPVTIPDLIDEYAQAIRGDWSLLDGRSVRSVLNELTGLIRERGNGQIGQSEAVLIRMRNGICASGYGHWREYCDEECVNE